MSELLNNQTAGVIGAGSFGTAVANLLAYNTPVLVYSRRPALVEQINTQHYNNDIVLSPRIRATNSLEEIAGTCDIIFPIVPSANFRNMIKGLAPYLRPYHILIHGTKGLDTSKQLMDSGSLLGRADVHTISEVIKQESAILRVGCLSGPNLAKEIMEGQPTATVVSSQFSEVIRIGQALLSSQHFHVFGTHDIVGAELAGALKNIIAIGSGILMGKGMGKNIQAVFITRGWHEMISLGKAMGSETSAFFGMAGIGDLVATATSENSRNYSLGLRLGGGESLEEIQKTMPELAEGVRTLKIMYQMGIYYKLRIPITNYLYKMVFEEFDFSKALKALMTYPYAVDVDFL